MKLENISDKKHVVKTLIIGATQYITGATNQEFLSLDKRDNTNKIQNAIIVFVTQISSGDHPSGKVNMLKNVG